MLTTQMRQAARQAIALIESVAPSEFDRPVEMRVLGDLAAAVYEGRMTIGPAQDDPRLTKHDEGHLRFCSYCQCYHDVRTGVFPVDNRRGKYRSVCHYGNTEIAKASRRRRQARVA